MGKKHKKSIPQENPWRIRIAVIAVLVTAFLIRIMPIHSVFNGTFVSFLEVDSYNQMWYAKQIHDMSFFSGFHYAVANNLLWSWTVATLGNIFPIELVGAWLPPILAAGTILLVYGIASKLFTRLIGLLSALFVAIIPSEFLNRTLLGYADHHALEVFLMSLTLFCLLKSFEGGKVWTRWTLATGLALFLYLANWTGGIIMVGVLGLTATVTAIYGIFRHKAWGRSFVSICLAIGVGFSAYLALGGYERYLPAHGIASIGASSQVFSEGLSTWFSPVSSRTISEIMPVLFPFGKFDLGVVLTNLNLFVFSFIAGFIILAAKMESGERKWALLVWTLAVVAMTLNMRRFLYYLTLPVGIVSAWVVVWATDRFKGDRRINLASLSIPAIIVSLTFANFVARGSGNQMPADWYSALKYLNTQPSGVVTAWSDYGHWIKYETKDTPNLLPGPGGSNVANLFLSTSENDADSLMGKLGTVYLVADSQTLQYKMPSVYQVAGEAESNVNSTLIARLVNKTNVPQDLKLVYENQSVKVYKRG